MIYPGTFDPLTNGHVDIARRAVRLCDKLVVAVLNNSSKDTVFSATERVEMVRQALGDKDTIQVVQYEGLLVDFYRQLNACAVIRGLRSESDFRFEAQMAAANTLMLPGYETCLLPCRIDLAFTSSSIVREVASYGGDISGMVPETIIARVQERLGGSGAKPTESRG